MMYTSEKKETPDIESQFLRLLSKSQRRSVSYAVYYYNTQMSDRGGTPLYEKLIISQ